jgi:hypothetical protein
MYKSMMQIIIRVPRLIRLVRKVRSDPLGPNAASEVTTLAEQLYHFDLREAVHSLVNRSAKRARPQDGKGSDFPV